MIRSYSSLFFWLGMTIAASLILYHTSDRVTALDHELHKLNAQIMDEQESLRVLKAEWVYLANPARVEAQAQRHLLLQPTAPRRIAGLLNMADLLPQRGDGSATLFANKAAPEKAVMASVAPVVPPSAKPDGTNGKHDRVFALLNEGRINDHMVMQHAAAAEAKRTVPNASGVALALAGAKTDKIGALIGALGLHQ